MVGDAADHLAQRSFAIKAVSMSVWAAAARSPPTSDPARIARSAALLLISSETKPFWPVFGSKRGAEPVGPAPQHW